jgi:hypothetical protein
LNSQRFVALGRNQNRPCFVLLPRQTVKIIANATMPRGDWLMHDVALKLRPVEQELRVDTVGVQAMATRWGASVCDLNNTIAPAGMGLSCQTSASAVNAAHVDVAAFTAGLAARVDERATGVTHADVSYLAQEATSTVAVAAVLQPVISE